MIKSLPASVAVLLLLIFSGSGLFAQDNVDDLFAVPDSTVDGGGSGQSDGSDPGATGEADQQAAEEDKVDLAALTTNSEPKISGNVEITGAAAYGLLNWTTLEDDFSLYSTMATTLSLDVSPRPDFRFYTSVATALDTDTLEMPMFSLSELFVDYTLNDFAFIRAGKQSFSWGQGLLLDNPGNVLSDMSDAFALKIFMPFGNNGLTAAAYGSPSWFNGVEYGFPIHPEYLGYAALFEMPLKNATLGVSAKYRYSVQQSLEGYVKSSIGPADLVVEGRVDSADVFSGDPARYDYTALTDMFLENTDIGFRFLAEYIFQATYDGGGRQYSQRFGLGLLGTSLRVLGWRPGIRWFHAVENGFATHSGQVIFGISRGIAPRLTANIGIPVSYGSESGYYMVNNEDPGGRVIGLVFQLTLENDF